VAKKQMKLGLIYLRTEDYKSAPVMVPNGLTYLASYLKKKLDYTDLVIDIDPEKVLSQKPDIIGISSFTESYAEAVEISRQIKEKRNIPIIIGGPHITALPDSLPETIDFGVLDEGEETIVELMQLFLEDKVSLQNLEEISGLVFHDRANRKKIKTKRRPWLDNIDLIPVPERNIFANLNRTLEQALFTSRGCPFKCTFCTAGEFWEKVRYHSVERVVEEIREIIKVAPQQKHIAIADDLFAMSKKRLKEIGEAIRSEGIHKKVFFSCNARASVFDDEIAILLREMNVRIVAFGIESANEPVLKFLKGHARASQNQRALDLCQKHGLFPLTHFLLGAKIETPAAAADTYWFIRKNWGKITKLDTFSAIPFPGTPFWYDAVQRGLIREEFQDWQVMNLRFDPDKSIFLNEHSSKEDFAVNLEKFHQISKKKESIEFEFFLKISEETYFQNLLKNFGKFIPENCEKILEVSPFREGISDYLPEKKEISKVTNLSSNNSNFNEEKFDLIFLNHTIERERNSEKELKKAFSLLKNNGRLIITNYNPQNISFLNYLLTSIEKKDLSLIFGEKLKSFATIKNLKKAIEKSGFFIQEIHKNPLSIDYGQKETIALYKNIFEKNDFFTEDLDYDIFSYVVIAVKTEENI